MKDDVKWREKIEERLFVLQIHRRNRVREVLVCTFFSEENESTVLNLYDRSIVRGD